ncbi:uncharacterized protein LOC135838816 [Planococcus citri]|uniref:uncharacterized protein LOC135838816 n=1 Tax=Planococcus citri TaxID=170843 RepID=UPI0031F8B181
MARVNLHTLLIASFFLIQTVDFSTCSLKTFRCHSGEYISSSLFCDGAKDCKDGSDEAAGCRRDAVHENPTEKNPTNGVVRPVKELQTIPLMEDEKHDDGEANDGEPEEPEIDEAVESYYDTEAVEENQPIKIYVEPRETPSTSSTTTPRIPYLRGKPEDDEHNNNNNASQTKSNTSTIEPPSTEINTNHGLMRKNYCIVLFIPALSYIFLM